jgi:Uma2 family endonuclease
MPVALSDEPIPPVRGDPPRRQWTREERVRLEESGLLNGERWELIEGELLRKMPKKRRHVQALAILTGWLISVFGDQSVNTEAPIDVSPEDNPTSQPEPDLIVLRPDYPDPWSRTPQPQDLLLVIEISDTTLEFDRSIKAGLYRRAAITEFWLLDLNARQLIVHRNPAGAHYQSIAAYSAAETVSPSARPDAAFPVSRAFPD